MLIQSITKKEIIQTKYIDSSMSIPRPLDLMKESSTKVSCMHDHLSKLKPAYKLLYLWIWEFELELVLNKLNVRIYRYRNFNIFELCKNEEFDLLYLLIKL